MIKEINDLAISPINPYILASASEDSTVRIWSLDPAHARQPCAAILEGDGHKETVLTLVSSEDRSHSTLTC
jgi:polycomb protein EED